MTTIIKYNNKNIAWDKMYGIVLCVMIGASLGSLHWLVGILTFIMFFMWVIAIDEEREEINNMSNRKEKKVLRK